MPTEKEFHKEKKKSCERDNYHSIIIQNQFYTSLTKKLITLVTNF